MYIADSQMAKEIDRYTIEEIGIPSMVLMENASRSIVKNIVTLTTMGKILVVVGNGNNGGDGVCVARILHQKGYDVSVYMVDTFGKYTKDLVNQIDIAKKCGVEFIADFNDIESADDRLVKFKECILKSDIILDGIFGIGLTRDVCGVYFDVINYINEVAQDKVVIAIDVPSGIDVTTAKVMGVAIKADYTITFGVNKLGLVLVPGRDYAGKVIVEDIGFSTDIVKKVCKYHSYEKDSYVKAIPDRIKDSNKGTYGKVLVIAGSKNMAGACYLSAKAAYKMGAGLVRVYTVEDNREIIQTLVPEAVLTTYDIESKFSSIDKDNSKNEQEELKKIEQSLQEAINWATVIVLGPGLGICEVSKKIVNYTLDYAKVPCVVDADALNILASGLDKISKKSIRLNNVILTPHIKELSRLLNKDIDYIKENMNNPCFLFNSLDYLREEYNNITHDKEENVLVIKDAVTATTTASRSYINTSGNNGLSTGGSGDVLTGIIAGLIAGGSSNFEAASLGVYIHGLCADEYVKQFNPYSLCASDILDYLEKVIGGIIDEKVL